MRINPGGRLDIKDVMGRDNEIARYWRVLARQGLVISAERRIGKTHIVLKMRDECQSGYMPFYHDLEAVHSMADLVRLIFGTVQESSDTRPGSRTTLCTPRLRSQVRRLRKPCRSLLNSRLHQPRQLLHLPAAGCPQQAHVHALSLLTARQLPSCVPFVPDPRSNRVHIQASMQHSMAALKCPEWRAGSGSVAPCPDPRGYRRGFRKESLASTCRQPRYPGKHYFQARLRISSKLLVTELS